MSKTASGPFAVGSNVYPGLFKLVEELGELAQVCGRLMQGHALGMAVHWDGHEHKVRLLEELADVSAMIDYVLVVNNLDMAEFHKRRSAKQRQFHEWHHEQKEQTK